ncbi:MAG TPA: MotA/TolQ/ExbB proton channel family protein [Candidatus Methylacidiphilales bacterium]|nr:MotA/TolQ/ExbB proton channel family protein [Candidatus Methylacidiphilales bacterium]
MLGSWTDTFVFSWYVMIPLMLCSVISLAIIFERIISLRFSAVVKPELARAIHDLHYGGKTTLVEQESLAEDTALARLVRACLMYTSWPKNENAEAVQAYARREIGRLERGLVFLEVVTGLGPLLGLLGTILGLIRIFGSAGSADLSIQGTQIAAGIAEAMYCTVAGLIVAIPALIAHCLFTRHIEALTIDLETLCSELLGKLYTQAETTP